MPFSTSYAVGANRVGYPNTFLGHVWSYFRKWRIDGTWCQIHSQLYRKMRAAENRAPHPTGAIIDSQSVKSPEQGGERGYDAGKKVNGRKRHIIVDTLGLLLFGIGSQRINSR